MEINLMCKYCGSENMARSYELKKFGLVCKRHARQLERYGKVFKTIYDSPDYRIEGDSACIMTYSKASKGEDRLPKAEFIIDLEDLNKVLSISWWSNKNGYILNTANRLQLHRFIMNCPDNMMVDHINGNPLDNRKINLRICTPHQNSMNLKKKKNNASGIVGVWWDEARKKWYARIKHNYKGIFLGRYDNIEDAKNARIKAEKEYFGDFRSDAND